ncbi:MAG: Do family serine endopeptidase [bacterium]|nr:Do family serine endopeptidase [bacterium]
MATSKRNALIIVTAVFLGIIVGLVISTNFNLIFNGIASNDKTSTNYEAMAVDTATSEDEPVQAISGSSDSYSIDSDDVDALFALEKAYINVSKQVKPWVVTITSEKYIKYRMFDPWRDFFGGDFFDFFGRRREGQDDGRERERTFVQEGLGSGVIVSANGYILTNNHVVQEADQIRVLTMDKKEYEAELVGRDDKTDVAVVRIKGNNLPHANIGDSDKIEVGQIVLALGNPFSKELQATVTNGIISAKGRSGIGTGTFYQDFIQTTAAINPGNSGGALVNLRGELIGINTAIMSRSGGFQGIGFAIPINMAKHAMNMLIEKGYVVRGYLGVIPQALDAEMAEAFGLKDNRGALIASVEKGTPADKAGLKEEDIVVAINGHLINDDVDFRLRIAEYEPDSKVVLKVFRNGKYLDITVKLAERPDDQPQKAIAQKETEKLGIKVTNLTDVLARRYGFEGQTGVLVTEVERTSQAYRKGVREGDLISSINRQTVESVRDYNRIVNKVDKGDVLVIRLKKRVGQGISNYYVTIRMSD